MAKRKTKRKTKRKVRRQPNSQDAYPGWMWMLFGLAIGLSVAFAIYMKDREPVLAVRPVAQQPASMSATMEQPVEVVVAEPSAEEGAADRRFDFYDMLPNFEVVIPEHEADVKSDADTSKVLQPGVYVLQAGSFAEYVDADRRRAQIALQGIESRIQRVMIDDKTYHRVRIGPLDDLDELNDLRNRLRQADIDVLRIRLGD
jgi:cell division protein FtsN